MNISEAIELRHSVRSYTDKNIEKDVLARLQTTVEECNSQSGLNMQLCINEPLAFSGLMAKFGRFRNVRNYLALVGKDSPDLDEKCGYYGEKVVLQAQMLGLNSCWVALTFSKAKCAANIHKDEKLALVVALGYGVTPGTGHKMKPVEALCRANFSMPEWFRKGVEAARLAPTALNQQKFCFELNEDAVTVLPGKGFYVNVDSGIAKCHFEAGADDAAFRWA